MLPTHNFWITIQYYKNIHVSFRIQLKNSSNDITWHPCLVIQLNWLMYHTTKKFNHYLTCQKSIIEIYQKEVILFSRVILFIQKCSFFEIKKLPGSSQQTDNKAAVCDICKIVLIFTKTVDQDHFKHQYIMECTWYFEGPKMQNQHHEYNLQFSKHYWYPRIMTFKCKYLYLTDMGSDLNHHGPYMRTKLPNMSRYRSWISWWNRFMKV